MAPLSETDTGRGNQDVDLLIETSRSISQIAKLLQSRERNSANNELKNFYGHLVGHCAIVLINGNRLKFEANPCNDFLAQILDVFESLISVQAAQSGLSNTNKYRKQHTLNQHWDVLRTQENDVKLRFVDQCLNVASSPELCPSAIDKRFLDWEAEFTTKYPESRSQHSHEDVPPNEARAEPSYVVWSTAQSLFKALTNSTKCECIPKHDLSATLCLGTYRNFDNNGSHDFDLCLSLQEDWQEAHVQTIRENVVRFAMNDAPPKKKLNYKPMFVKKLCEKIVEKRSTSDRLELQVERGRLLKLRSARGKVLIDGAKPAVSLQHFIDNEPRSLTEKTKRILAVLLSYAVLHLHGTPWLQPTWDSSHILFFRTTTPSDPPLPNIPLRPFIHTQLRFEGMDSDLTSSEMQQDDDCSMQDPNSSPVSSSDDFDDLDPDDLEHPFPTLVTLAIMLMELYLATPFGDLAEKCKIRMPERPDSRTQLLNVASVFDAYKHEIPENSQFFSAIGKCLDPRIWENEQQERMDDQTLRVAIYREVIRPLEDELCAAFTFITIGELDQMAKKVDMENWGQAIHTQMAEGIPSKTSNPSANGSSFSDPGRKSADRPEYESARFYDDEKPSNSHPPVDYLNWRNRYREVYKKHIDPYLHSAPKSRVRIAVLDSGVDDTLDALDTGQIVAKYSWTSTKNRKSAPDRDGHGTFVASLLIDYAPDAKLFVAKIADKEPPRPRHVAEAIQKAVDEWNVDIISMSFGYPTNRNEEYKELQNALLYAHSKGVLMFAAASNSGANLDRAYPARDPNVICVHSTDSQGNRSKFSPTAILNDDNLATIGEDVASVWPAHLCDLEVNPDCVKIKSGTSYATPIAAGIAAFLLQYARIHLKDVADMLKRQSAMKAVLVKVAEKTQASIARDSYHYISLSLYSDNLFGKEKYLIDATLRDIINQ